jgi:hypothetical protein
MVEETNYFHLDGRGTMIQTAGSSGGEGRLICREDVSTGP